MKLRIVIALLFALSSAQAVILYRTDDTGANTTAPTGADTNSGWQYEGVWGGFLGTPIAPHFFLSAAHIGNAGNSIFTYLGATYHIIGWSYDPASDLVLWETAEAFPSFAPLYSRTDEVGGRLIAIGRGTQRGTEVLLGATLKGWRWGGVDSAQRWGENLVSSIAENGPAGTFDLLRATFDASGLPNECHLSSGDSGGAVFLKDGGVWKLAGINYSVDGHFAYDSLGTAHFDAALFDRSGLYEGGESGPYDPANGPSALYATRISTKLPWLAGLIARGQAGQEGNFLTLTYTKFDVPPTDLTYQVEQSIDLISWSPATASTEIISTNGSTQLVKAKVDMGSNPVLFIRLQIARP